MVVVLINNNFYYSILYACFNQLASFIAHEDTTKSYVYYVYFSKNISDVLGCV